MSNILEEAGSLVAGSRQRHYGSPNICIKRTAMIASILLDRNVTDEEIVKINIAQKLARTVNKDTREHWKDNIGYIHILCDKLDRRMK